MLKSILKKIKVDFWDTGIYVGESAFGFDLVPDDEYYDLYLYLGQHNAFLSAPKDLMGRLVGWVRENIVVDFDGAEFVRDFLGETYET